MLFLSLNTMPSSWQLPYPLNKMCFLLDNGKEDVAIFDFTSMYSAEYAAKILERKGKRLLIGKEEQRAREKKRGREPSEERQGEREREREEREREEGN